jgi:hypothetical protein
VLGSASAAGKTEEGGRFEKWWIALRRDAYRETGKSGQGWRPALTAELKLLRLSLCRYL